MMGTALDYLNGGTFGFSATSEFIRQRAVLIADPYNPDSLVEDWEAPNEITLAGYFASASSAEQAGEVREQVVTTKRLVIDNPAADVRRGDRIKQGDRVWTVTGFPEDDKSPFTGWQPTLVANLEEVQG